MILALNCASAATAPSYRALPSNFHTPSLPRRTAISILSWSPGRTGRRKRALAQMEAHDLDILILGRQSNIRYVSGAQQLWVAGTRPFAPSCVLLRNGAVHLLSTWDEGVPEDIPHENLYGIAWNPMNTIENLRKIPGAATARRVGSDALSPSFAQLLPMAFPNAELVDGEPAIRAARRIKTAEEIATLRESVRVAEVGLATAKVWGLYMAGSRLGFETNVVQLHQVLAVKVGASGDDGGLPLRPWWTA